MGTKTEQRKRVRKFLEHVDRSLGEDFHYRLHAAYCLRGPEAMEEMLRERLAEVVASDSEATE